MTPGRMLIFPLVVIVFPVAKGQSCSFIEVPGQKGSDSLWSDTATDTSLSACKTLCNTTELCIAGEFLSTTNTCHIYLVETNLTGQTETVFFQWTYTNERDVSDGFPVALTVGLVVGGVALAGMAAAGTRVGWILSRTQVGLPERTDPRTKAKKKKNFRKARHSLSR